VSEPTWWQPSFRADPRGVKIADRHYNRQSIGSPQFVPPGACLVFRHDDDALWVTSNPKPKYVKHDWAGAWVNSCFRNEETGRLASELITEAVAHSRSRWDPPPLGIVSFIDDSKVRSMGRDRPPGYCYLMAGWTHVGFTKGGLWVYQQLPDEMPDPRPIVAEGQFDFEWGAEKALEEDQ
jgi:hypothetical protein